MNNKSFSGEGREKFASRLGFVLISAGCAIGLGNVWRFPYIVGQYGGAAFILLYLLFLVIFGLPIMTMEFSVGRASGKSIADSFRVLEPKGTKWHWFGWVGMLGNYMLMMFYTTITGWMFIYLVKMLKGDFVSVDTTQITQQFELMKANPLLLAGAMALVTAVGFLICSFGLKNGVEKITKVMMLALLTIIVVLAIYVMTLSGAGEGYKYYLIPDFNKLFYSAEGKFIFGDVVFAALGQAFFTLSIGMGSMAIFGSHISKDRRLLGEATTIAALDTGVAFVAGLIVIPACFAFGVDQKAGPGLIFEALPAVFNSMGPVGCVVWGSLFFVFMLFAALSTVVAVFENIISFGCELWGWSRRKSCLINFGLMVVLALPCVFGFNILSGITPLGAGSNLMDLEDFIISNNILPLGSLVYVLFCALDKKAWGWNQFLTEANTGKGLKFPKALRFYCKWILPILLIVLWAQGILTILIK
ncbi:MAG: sodium-dependent transporter [Clostridia bacterium]|nr:sodium-dependent transporter [Clostridia bacterium]